VLHDRRHGHHRHALGLRGHDRLLHGDRELSGPGGDGLEPASLARLNDLEVDACVVVPTVGRGEKDPAVVGVGRPVEHECH
jgi:hypothetical protein